MTACILTLLTLSQTLSEALEIPETLARRCYADQGLGRAPGNALPRLDLPPVEATETGLLLDAESARELVWRLGCYWRWPDACQIVLDAQQMALTTRLELEREAADRLLELSTEPEQGFDLATVVMVGLAGVVLGAIGVGAVVVAM